MKNTGRKKMRDQMVFGDFVAAVCAASGKRKGSRIVQWAVNRGLVEFLGIKRSDIPEKWLRTTAARAGFH
jgi:hypothetical protein